MPSINLSHLNQQNNNPTTRLPHSFKTLQDEFHEDDDDVCARSDALTDMVNTRVKPYGDRSEFTSPTKSQGRVSMAYTRGVLSAHMGAEPDQPDHDDDDQPSTAKLMVKFTTMYQELETRLERGISFAKEATLENKLRASSNSAMIGAGGMGADPTCEILDLKAEMTSMKNKLFQAEQKRIEEVNKR